MRGTMTLLELGEAAEQLEQLLLEATDKDGEVEAEQAAILEQWFKEIDNDRNNKLDSYGALIRQREAYIAARKEERERLAMHIQTDENLIKRLKDRLKMYMEMCGEKRIETTRYKISVSSNGGLVPLDPPDPDPATLPKQFIIEVPRADKVAIRGALERGEHVPGCRLLGRGTHVRIS